MGVPTCVRITPCSFGLVVNPKSTSLQWPVSSSKMFSSVFVCLPLSQHRVRVDLRIQALQDRLQE